jgi:hypothetical protein
MRIVVLSVESSKNHVSSIVTVSLRGTGPAGDEMDLWARVYCAEACGQTRHVGRTTNRD